MNELIKHFAQEAGFKVDWQHEDVQAIKMARYEKFAELIVQECAEQIISKGTDWVDFAPSQTGVRPEYWNMAQQIKQHFGVK